MASNVMVWVERFGTDSQGIERLYLIPENDPDTSRGVPISLDLGEIIGHMPVDWQRFYYGALYEQGLITAKDYFSPNALSNFRAAMQTILKHDFLSAQALAKQELQNGESA